MTYFAFGLPNRPGELARFAGRVRDAGINLVGLWGYTEGGEEPRLSCVPAAAGPFREFAESTGLDFEEGKTCYFSGDDRIGALVQMLERVSEAGINVDAIECVGTGQSFGCFIWADDEQWDALEKVLTT